MSRCSTRQGSGTPSTAFTTNDASRTHIALHSALPHTSPAFPFHLSANVTKKRGAWIACGRAGRCLHRSAGCMRAAAAGQTTTLRSICPAAQRSPALHPAAPARLGERLLGCCPARTNAAAASRLAASTPL
jgi:hypothetical protein